MAAARYFTTLTDCLLNVTATTVYSVRALLIPK